MIRKRKLRGSQRCVGAGGLVLLVCGSECPRERPCVADTYTSAPLLENVTSHLCLSKGA